MTPEETQALVHRSANIPTTEIEKDIWDTRKEIQNMDDEARHLECTPFTSPDWKMNSIRASGRRNGIKQREAFIEKLQAILEHRGAPRP